MKAYWVRTKARELKSHGRRWRKWKEKILILNAQNDCEYFYMTWIYIFLLGYWPYEMSNRFIIYGNMYIYFFYLHKKFLFWIKMTFKFLATPFVRLIRGLESISMPTAFFINILKRLTASYSRICIYTCLFLIHSMEPKWETYTGCIQYQNSLKNNVVVFKNIFRELYFIVALFTVGEKKTIFVTVIILFT